jgi:tRNA-specific 2-thiouridylase
VVKKDIKNNNLVVSKDEKDLLSKGLYFYKTNWISKKQPKLPLTVKVKIRYRSKLVLAVIKEKNLLVFKKPQRAVTSGQSVVFYKDNELLGGGVIK